LYRFALALSRQPQTAEDLVQETYLRAWRERDRFRADAAPVTWFRRILHNVAVDRMRRLRKELLVEDVEADWRDDGYSVDSHTVLERAQTREELEDALVHVPFIYRAAVLLHDVEGLTAREIAEALDLGLPAVKQRLRRGRMMLVNALARGAERRQAMRGVPMSCWDARRLVSDYLDDALPDGARRGLECHLERCPTCPPLYASLVGVRSNLGDLHDPDTVVAPQVAERIAHAVRSATGSGPSP
jgi:RNA polymerase sigma-70 factor (ECF subfamily)